MVKALLKSSLIASAVFAAAWFRLPPTVEMIGRNFVSYGVLITIFAFVLGLPLAFLIERLKIGRWWSYLAIAAATGALLGAFFSSHPGCAARIPGSGELYTCVENPRAITFSPWTQSHLGFVDDIQWKDYLGTIAFGALIGGALGTSFWFFYPRNRKT